MISLGIIGGAGQDDQTNIQRLIIRGFQKSPYPMLGALNDEIARGGLCED